MPNKRHRATRSTRGRKHKRSATTTNKRIRRKKGRMDMENEINWA